MGLGHGNRPDGAGDLFGALPVRDATHIDLGGGNLAPRAPSSRQRAKHRLALQQLERFTVQLGHIRAGRPHGSNMCERVADHVAAADVATVRAILAARFDWVSRLDSGRLVEALDNLIGELAIERVLPSHGMIVSGSSAVTSFLRTVGRRCSRPNHLGSAKRGKSCERPASSQTREA